MKLIQHGIILFHQTKNPNNLFLNAYLSLELQFYRLCKIFHFFTFNIEVAV